jgi:hypothetical protein
LREPYSQVLTGPKIPRQVSIRDFETVQALAQAAGLILLEDNAMPANNQLLVWQKR